MPMRSEKRSSGPWQFTVPRAASWRSSSTRIASARRALRQPRARRRRRTRRRAVAEHAARGARVDGVERLVELVGRDVDLAHPELGELLGARLDVAVAGDRGADPQERGAAQRTGRRRARDGAPQQLEARLVVE